MKDNMECNPMKTWLLSFTKDAGNGWAIVNATSPNNAIQTFLNQTKFENCKVVDIKEEKYYGEYMQVCFEGSITTYSGEKGDPGEQGVGLEYQWDGTSLGVKREDEENYEFTNLAQGLDEKIADLESQIASIDGTGNADIVSKESVDIKVVETVPVEELPVEYVIIRAIVAGDADLLYKYEDEIWRQVEPDSSILYYDIDDEKLLAYRPETFYEVTPLNTFIIGETISASKTLKSIKDVGTYNIIQRITSNGKKILKNWTLVVQLADYEDDPTDTIYQKLTYNYVIYKRSYKQATDKWSSWVKYYEGLVRDTKTSGGEIVEYTSPYYTWSSQKIRQAIDEGGGGGQTYTAGNNISIINNRINALGYTYYSNINSIIEGDILKSNNSVDGQHAHSEGYNTTAGGDYSHSEGYFTSTSNDSEHACGKFNVSHNGTIFSIGIGTSSESSNAFEVMENGNIFVVGVGNYDGIHSKWDDPNIRTLQHTLSIYEEDISDLSDNVNDLTHQLYSEEPSWKGLIERVSDNENSISSLSVRVGNNTDSITNLDSTLSGVQSDINDLNTAMTQGQTAITNHETRITALENQLQGLDTALQSINNTLSNL